MTFWKQKSEPFLLVVQPQSIASFAVITGTKMIYKQECDGWNNKRGVCFLTHHQACIASFLVTFSPIWTPSNAANQPSCRNNGSDMGCNTFKALSIWNNYALSCHRSSWQYATNFKHADCDGQPPQVTSWSRSQTPKPHFPWSLLWTFLPKQSVCCVMGVKMFSSSLLLQ